MKKFGSLFILLAGLFWGNMGIFLNATKAYGFSPVQCSTLRVGCAALMLWITIALLCPKNLKIRFKDLRMPALAGAIGVGGMSALYLSAIHLTSLSVAAVLLYTSPIWVMLFSVLFLKEKFTLLKGTAALLAFLGCVLITGFGGANASVWGLALGLLSGISYGLYSIFGTVALKKNNNITVTCYAFLFAALVLLIIGDVPGIVRIAAHTENPFGLWTTVLLNGLITAVIPFALYTLGLQYVTASKAAVLACIEPLTASVFGAVLYHEQLNYLGILLILGAICLLQVKFQKIFTK